MRKFRCNSMHTWTMPQRSLIRLEGGDIRPMPCFDRQRPCWQDLDSWRNMHLQVGLQMAGMRRHSDSFALMLVVPNIDEKKERERVNS